MTSAGLCSIRQEVRDWGDMGEFSIWHWLLVIAIALLLFGTSKFTAVGKGIGEGIRNFKAAMKEGEEPKKEKEEEKKS